MVLPDREKTMSGIEKHLHASNDNTISAFEASFDISSNKTTLLLKDYLPKLAK